MGKSRSSSWLTDVERAFRSPTKDTEKRSGRGEYFDQEEDEEKVITL